jgi:hypothetical protein
MVVEGPDSQISHHTKLLARPQLHRTESGGTSGRGSRDEKRLAPQEVGLRFFRQAGALERCADHRRFGGVAEEPPARNCLDDRHSGIWGQVLLDEGA